MKKSLVLFILFFIWIGNVSRLFAQNRLTISQAVYLIDKSQSSVYDSLARKNYSYKGKNDVFEKFERDYRLDYSLLNVGFKNKKLNAISWSESVMYASIVMGEVLSNGFVFDNRSLSTFQVFKNESKGLMISLFDNSTSGYITINLGKLSDNEKKQIEKEKDKKIHRLLPEPMSILKYTYRQLVDSLKKNKIDYRVDSAFGEDYFIGFHLTTKDGQYSFSEKYVTESYTFQIQASIEDVKKALATKKIQVKKLEEDYYQCTYKGCMVTFLKWEDQVTDISYSRITKN